MVDISSVGTSAVLTIGGSNSINITEWADEGTPFSIATGTQLTTSKKNFNGEMISSRTPSIIQATISLIPDSSADIRIRELLTAGVLSPRNAADISTLIVNSLVFTIPNNDGSSAQPQSTYTITLTNGRFAESDIGAATNDEGRKTAKNYTFEFEGIEIAGASASDSAQS